MRIVLIGAGKGGFALITTFSECRDVHVVGVADINFESEGLKLAEKLKIPIASHFEELVTKDGIDLIINVTGASGVTERIRELIGNRI